MCAVTKGQKEKTFELIDASGIDSPQYQRLLEGGRFTQLLREYKERFPEPTIEPVSFPRDYNRTLVQMRDAMECYGYVNKDLNDENFPVTVRDDDRELVLICFNRDINDHEDPAKSELLKELDKLGYKPEYAPELCMLGEHEPEMQREFPIVARGQVWRSHNGDLVCPILGERVFERSAYLNDVRRGWRRGYRFLASRK
jgi:hypothetical protein